MTGILRGRLGIVWLALVVATGISWWLGTDHGTDSATAATAGVMAAAFVKVRLIGIHFMELRDAPLWLRLFLELYVAVIAITLFVLYLLL